MVTAILAGVALGALHAVTGPDHVAAVVPMSLGTPWKGARTGLGWGAGHGVGVAVLQRLDAGLLVGRHDVIAEHVLFRGPAVRAADLSGGAREALGVGVLRLGVEPVPRPVRLEIGFLQKNVRCAARRSWPRSRA